MLSIWDCQDFYAQQLKYFIANSNSIIYYIFFLISSGNTKSFFTASTSPPTFKSLQLVKPQLKSIFLIQVRELNEH